MKKKTLSETLSKAAKELDLPSKNIIQKDNISSMEELIFLLKDVEMLIDDNNQNIKDCLKLIKEIKTQICPPPKSWTKIVISKILNKTCGL